MSVFKQDFERSFKVIKGLEEHLNAPGCFAVKDDLMNLIYMLDSPLFTQLVNLQDALLQLRALSLQRQLSASKFDFDKKSGKLVVYPPENDVEGMASSTSLNTGAIDSVLWKRLEPMAEGRVVETVVLEKGSNASLGFGVVGLKSAQRGDLGIYVQEIQPGGVAARTGRLHKNDEILAVDGQVFESGISHEQAVRILQKASGRIQLVVARTVEAESTTTTATTTSSEKAWTPPPAPLPPVLSDTAAIGSGTATDGLDMVLSTEWTQLEVINLVNDGSGLGFGIIGGKSTGVVVKTILPGGIADRDGRLRSGDHLIQIGDINVRGMGSEQVASVLRQSGAHVRLIVARGIVEPSPIYPPYAPVIPTQQLSEHINHLNALMSGYPDYGIGQEVDPSVALMMTEDVILPAEIHPPPLEVRSSTVSLGPEVEVFSIELVKDAVGLGVTVVGYVSTNAADESLSGIFVRSIADGSAAALDGRIQVNDQIIAVDDQSLDGFTNQESVDILRNTGQVVRLKLARYRYGRKHDLLCRNIAQANETGLFGLEDSRTANESIYIVDYNDYRGLLHEDKEDLIVSKWKKVIGDNHDIVVAQLSKFKEGGGLGISLEGTVDVENGVEVHPHHYIRSVLSDGPVGLNGRLQSSDELLEVNGINLYGLNHVEVVTILKELPQHVCLVCARRKPAVLNPTNYLYAPVRDQFFQIPSPPPTNIPLSLGHGDVPIFGDRLVKAKSEQALPVAEVIRMDSPLSRLRSRSLEPLTGLAMWGNDVVVIELQKGDRGLGFSILDYQDPLNPMETVIVIRSLVPGGVAQLDGRLVPGDRLLFVNDINLEHASLDQAVLALKGASKGMVLLGVAKPLPLPCIGDSSSDLMLNAPRHLERDLFTSLGPSSQFFGNVEPLLSSSQGSSWKESSFNEASMNLWDIGKEISSSKLAASVLNPPAQFAQRENTRDFSSAMTWQAVVTKSENNALAPSAVEFLNHSTVNSCLKDASGSSREESLGSSSTLSQERELNALAFDSESSGTKPLFLGIDQVSLQSESGTSRSSRDMTSPNLQPGSRLMSPGSTKPELPPKPKMPYKSMAAPPVHTAVSEELHALPPSTEAQGSKVLSESSKCDGPYVPSSSLRPFSADIPVRYNEEVLPNSLERTIKISKGSGPLGIVVESTNSGTNGCIVKTIVANEAVAKDGNIQIGDLIVRINNENMRRVTNAQARAILRRSTLLATDISITYIAAADVALQWKASDRKDKDTEKYPGSGSAFGGGQANCLYHSTTGPSYPMLPSSKKFALPLDEGRAADNTRTRLVNDSESKVVSVSNMLINSSPSSATDVASSGIKTASQDVGTSLSFDATQMSDVASRGVSDVTLAAVAKQINRAEEDNLEPGQLHRQLVASYRHLEGDIHLVTVERGPGATCLGLCLAGNKDLRKMSIFVAGIVPNSPVACDGRIHIGDQLLQVNDKVLYGHSHLHASAIISSVIESQLNFILLRHPNFQQHMAKSAAKLPIVPYKDDPSTCISQWPTSQLSLQGAVSTCLTNGLPSVLQEQTATVLPTDTHLLDKTSEENESCIRVDDKVEEVKQGICKSVEAEIPKTSNDLVNEVDDSQLKSDVIQNSEISQENTEQNCREPSGEKSEEKIEATKDTDLQELEDKDEIQMKELNSEDEQKKTGEGFEENVEQVEDGRELNVEKQAEQIEDGAYQVENGIEQVKEEEDQDGDGQNEEENEQHGAKEDNEKQEEVEQSERATEVEGIEDRDKNDTEKETVEDLETIEEKEKDVETGVVCDDQESKGQKVEVFGKDNTDAEKVKAKNKSSSRRRSGNAAAVMEGDAAADADLERDDKCTDRLKATRDMSSSSSSHHSLPNNTSQLETPTSVRHGNPAVCRIVPGHETTIEINKGQLALGLDVIGGINTLLGVILIHEIYENGAAAKDGRLAIGDQILEVNGELFHDITDEMANEILRQTPSLVRMVVYREETPLKEDEIYDIFNLDLLKKPGKGLGISIVGREKNNGVFISDIIKGGVADVDGQLMPGDQILVINGTDVRRVSQQHAAEMLKTLIGRVSLTVGRVKCLSRSTSRSSSSLSDVDSDEDVATPASAQKRDQSKDRAKDKVTR